jgi:hypothetical protein
MPTDNLSERFAREVLGNAGLVEIHDFDNDLQAVWEGVELVNIENVDLYRVASGWECVFIGQEPQIGSTPARALMRALLEVKNAD